MPRLVRDWMTAEVVTVELETPLDGVVNHMYEGNFRHLPVLDGAEVVGLISYTDLIRIGFGEALSDDEAASAQTVMVGPVVTTSPTTPLSEAGALMLQHRFSCLPVLEDGQLVGILTNVDFVRGVVEGR
jgi:CBS domain-containing protein